MDLINREKALEHIVHMELFGRDYPVVPVDILKKLPSVGTVVHVSEEVSEELYEKIKHEMRDTPVILLPSEQQDIIRCKDCRYYEWMSNRVPEEQTWYCHNWNAETGKGDYCSYAERRQE